MAATKPQTTYNTVKRETVAEFLARTSPVLLAVHNARLGK
jgi:hypothetical protein